MTVNGRSVQKREKGELVLFMLMITERTMADKDRILSDQPDVFPVDHHILSSSEKTEKTLFAVYHDRKYFCIFCIYLYIIHKADATAVGAVDDLLVSQVRDLAAAHKNTSHAWLYQNVYAGTGGIMTISDGFRHPSAGRICRHSAC